MKCVGSPQLVNRRPRERCVSNPNLFVASIIHRIESLQERESVDEIKARSSV